MNKVIIFICILFLFSVLPSYAYWEIDQSEFNNWLCQSSPKHNPNFVMYMHAKAVNRDYKLMDDLFRSYKGLKDQLDKDMKKLIEYENYSKKLLEKEESNE